MHIRKRLKRGALQYGQFSAHHDDPHLFAPLFQNVARRFAHRAGEFREFGLREGDGASGIGEAARGDEKPASKVAIDRAPHEIVDRIAEPAHVAPVPLAARSLPRYRNLPEWLSSR
jgi:hypothetical protein